MESTLGVMPWSQIKSWSQIMESRYGVNSWSRVLKTSYGIKSGSQLMKSIHGVKSWSQVLKQVMESIYGVKSWSKFMKSSHHSSIFSEFLNPGSTCLFSRVKIRLTSTLTCDDGFSCFPSPEGISPLSGKQKSAQQTPEIWRLEIAWAATMNFAEFSEKNLHRCKGHGHELCGRRMRLSARWRRNTISTKFSPPEERS